VRDHGGRGGSGDHQCDERAGNDGHWCAHSGPVPSAPRETEPRVLVVEEHGEHRRDPRADDDAG
jgi:hypothetical protein